MKNILLVEPEYKNKYPPLGLMKISAYHKSKGDNVRFVKGVENLVAGQIWDRIYITTLFTFDFDISVKTIRFYKHSVHNIDDIFVGGILASLDSDDIRDATGVDNIIIGQLVNSSMLGYEDNVNIDEIVPDYEILDSITYRYPAKDAYFLYASRGCPNKCSFCVVPKLEPEFRTINNIRDQILAIDKAHGPKKTLILLDNNILHSDKLNEVIDEILEAGFVRGKVYSTPNPLEIALRRFKLGGLSKEEVTELFSYLHRIKSNSRKADIKEQLADILNVIESSHNLMEALTEHLPFISEVVEKYRSKAKGHRYVDFNQGLDSSLINETTLAQLSRIPLRPIRIAFDFIAEEKTYRNAVKLACNHGIREISNYMLYNFKDRPEDLWKRLKVNVELSKELGVHIFCFPMKYVPLDHRDRFYTGDGWNHKYLKAILAIINVTGGIVTCDGHSFFEKAFGATLDEYFEILSMPKDLITYRFHYERVGIKQLWKNAYDALSSAEKNELLEIVSNGVLSIKQVLYGGCYSKSLAQILPFYLISYKKETVAAKDPSTILCELTPAPEMRASQELLAL